MGTVLEEERGEWDTEGGGGGKMHRRGEDPKIALYLGVGL